MIFYLKVTDLEQKILKIDTIYYLRYNENVSFLTITINEFRNKHCGRGGSTHHLHQNLLGVNQNRRVSKSYSFVRDCSVDIGLNYNCK